MYRLVYRNVFSRIDPEQIHDVAIGGLRLAGDIPLSRLVLRAFFDPPVDHHLKVNALGLEFAHPLGLAGGFDKNAQALHGLGALGFSFLEVGTVTPRPQPGNDRPRIFRLPEDEALINRLGFPSDGMEAVARRLEGMADLRRPLIISLGKNKQTPLDRAKHDYGAVLGALYRFGQAFAINISSPNTPDLRQLQTPQYLADLLDSLRHTLVSLADGAPPKPLLLKVSPDLDSADLNTLLDLALQFSVAGIIATNTSLTREGLRSTNRDETGGLSGRPLCRRSTEMIRHIRAYTGDHLTIIGVGGIFTGDDIAEKLDAGASLVQAYTGFIYEGPLFVRKCIAGLQRHLAARRVAETAQAELSRNGAGTSDTVRSVAAPVDGVPQG